MRDDFAIFILSHGRADNIKTLKSLQDSNYTGKYYIVIDNEDKQAEEYYERYGDKVVMFDKAAMAKRFDTMDQSNDRRMIVYARNYCFDLAADLGLKYFLELDDDYTRFEYKHPKGKQLLTTVVRQFDKLCELMIEWLEQSGAVTVAFSQGGDHIGGLRGQYSKKVLRKAMNTFFCKTDRRIWWTGRQNEDVTAYTTLGNRGDLFLTITDISVVPVATQKGKGGCSDVYLEQGTYVKSFYSVMASPNAVKVDVMHSGHDRIHHKVDWDRCAPKILNERYKKGSAESGKEHKRE